MPHFVVAEVEKIGFAQLPNYQYGSLCYCCQFETDPWLRLHTSPFTNSEVSDRAFLLHYFKNNKTAI